MEVLSDRKSCFRISILSLTTMLLITVVKSSLALSLGLVGALSIVRFRTPIKEPEDLLYLFFSIAIGLGLGANQIMVTCLMAGVIMILLIILGNIRDRSLNIDGTTLTIEVQGHHDIGSYITVLSGCSRVSSAVTSMAKIDPLLYLILRWMMRLARANQSGVR